MTKAEKALEYFNKGFSCSQAVLCAFAADYSLDENTALKISDTFGAGMRGLSESCGAITGAFMVIGLKHGRIDPEDAEAKDKMSKKILELVNQFKSEYITISCRELLGYDISDPEQRQKALEKGQAHDFCNKFVKLSAELLDEILGSSVK